MSQETSLLLTLFLYMGQTEDTNILRRGGEKALLWVQNESRHRLNRCLKSPELCQEQMRQLDREMVKRNLSPGGSADLLALTLLASELWGGSAIVSEESYGKIKGEKEERALHWIFP